MSESPATGLAKIRQRNQERLLKPRTAFTAALLVVLEHLCRGRATRERPKCWQFMLRRSEGVKRMVEKPFTSKVENVWMSPATGDRWKVVWQGDGPV
jgi:hypothetical protein